LGDRVLPDWDVTVPRDRYGWPCRLIDGQPGRCRPGCPPGSVRNGASRVSSSGTVECGSMAARSRRDSSHRA